MSFVERDGIVYRIEHKSVYIEYISELFSSEITIPQEIENKPVIGIKPNAFVKSKITTIKIPDTVHVIHHNAFMDCENLTRVEIYPSMPINGKFRDSKHLILGNSAFLRCVNLHTFITTQTTVYVGEDTFRDCFYLEDLGSGILHAKKDAFTNCNNLKSLTLRSDARLWAGSIEKSKIQHLNIWGNVKMTASVVNFIKRKNITIHCEPNSNVTELSYLGVNVSYLY